MSWTAVLVAAVAVALFLVFRLAVGAFLHRRMQDESAQDLADPNPDGQDQADPDKPSRQKTSPPASKTQGWLRERRESLEGKLRELHLLRSELQSRNEWRDHDGKRLAVVEMEVEDFLAGASLQPEESYRAACVLHQEGPHTSVPPFMGCWVIYPWVKQIDAHLELLCLHARTRLQMPARPEEAIAGDDRYIAELEKCIRSAGLDDCDFPVPQYAIINAVRQITGKPLVSWTHKPMISGPAAAMKLIKVADALPDVLPFFPAPSAAASPDAWRATMDAYTSAREAAWRHLTEDEERRVLARLAPKDLDSLPA